MEIRRFLVIFMLNILGAPVYGWEYFTKFTDLTLTSSVPESKSIHSEYYFGDCRRSGITFYTMVHVTNLEMAGKIIMRGWIHLQRIPTCIMLRAYSPEEQLFRSTAYNFQMCVPRITYCHSKHIYKYYYYEWYIPTDYTGGMDWDITFFGPPSLYWE